MWFRFTRHASSSLSAVNFYCVCLVFEEDGLTSHQRYRFLYVLFREPNIAVSHVSAFSIKVTVLVKFPLLCSKALQRNHFRKFPDTQWEWKLGSKVFLLLIIFMNVIKWLRTFFVCVFHINWSIKEYSSLPTHTYNSLILFLPLTCKSLLRALTCHLYALASAVTRFWLSAGFFEWSCKVYKTNLTFRINPWLCVISPHVFWSLVGHHCRLSLYGALCFLFRTIKEKT